MGTSMDEIPNFREFLYQYILPQPELDLEALQGDRVELENLHAVLAEAQTRAAALEQIVRMAGKLLTKRRMPLSTGVRPCWPAPKRMPVRMPPGRAIWMQAAASWPT